MSRKHSVVLCATLWAVFVISLVNFTPKSTTAEFELINGSSNVCEVEHLILIDIEYIAKCIYAESASESEECQRLVIDCILNQADKSGVSPTEIINRKGNFEVVSLGTIYKAPVLPEIVDLIQQELARRTDSKVLYFRTNHYHTFGTPHRQIDDMYFSTN